MTQGAQSDIGNRQDQGIAGQEDGLEFVRMESLGHLRWSCRRGLLELDLILARFLDRHFEGMDAEQRGTLRELLEHSDNDLLDWVMGRQEPPDPRYRSMVQLIRAS